MMIAENDSSTYQLEEAKRFIAENDDFIVVSHVQPDGDAASSTMAVGLMLKQLGKTFLMGNSDRIPAKFEFLPGCAEIRRLHDGEAPARTFRHVIAVDCADFSRIGSAARWFSPDAEILNIDHHPTNDKFGSVLLIRSGASATAEILADFADELGIGWNKDLADCIYTGLMTDTGGFRYANTTPRVMQLAARMLRYGTEAHLLAERLLERMPFSHILLLKRALATLSFEKDNRISWIKLSRSDIAESGASGQEMEGLVNYPRNIEGVEVGILFKEVEPDKVKVSFRSAGNIDVASLAKRLGGGGHLRAAGCTLEMTLDAAISHVIGLVKRELP